MPQRRGSRIATTGTDCEPARSTTTKLIVAWIGADRVDGLITDLASERDLPGITVDRHIDGFGRGHGFGPNDRPENLSGRYNLRQRARIEIAVAADDVEPYLEMLRKHLHTGSKGDGKILVLPVDDALRVSTGERGRDAV